MSSTAVASIEHEVPPQPRLRDALTPRLMVVLAIAFGSAISTYMVMPFFAIYYHQTLGFSVALSGSLVGLPFLSAIVFGIVGGYLTDRIGALRASAVAMTVYGLCIGVLGVLHAPLAIAGILLLAGVMMPILSSGTSSLLNQYALPEHRGLMQNYLYWVNNCGVIVGLLVSSDLLHAGHSNHPFFAIAGLRILLAIALLVMLLGSRKQKAAASEVAQGDAPQSGGTDVQKRRRPSMLAAFRTAASDRALLFAALTFMMLMMMESQIDSVIPLDLTAHFHNGARIFGPLIAINAVVVVLGQPLVLKWYGKKPPLPVFGVGAVLTGCGLALGGIVGTLPAWIGGIVLYSIGEILWGCKINDLLGELPTPGNNALYFATINTAQSFAFFLGTSLGSTLYEAFHPAVLFGSMIAVGVVSVYLFRVAIAAYGRRMALIASTSGVVAALPGAEAVRPMAQAAGAEGYEEPLAIQGAASFQPPRSGEPLFGKSSQSEKLVLLERLSDDEWTRLLAATEVVAFAPGEVVLTAGETDRSLYIVQAGRLEVLAPGRGQAGPALSTIETGSVFGEQAFVDGRPRSASIQAVTQGELRKLDFAAYEQLTQLDPQLAQAFMTDLARVLSERLRRTTQYVNLMFA